MLGTITFLIIRYEPYTMDRYFDGEAAKSHPEDFIIWYLRIFFIWLSLKFSSLYVVFVSQVDRVNDQILRRNSRRVSFTLRKVHLILAFVSFCILLFFTPSFTKFMSVNVFSFARNPYLIHCLMNHCMIFSTDIPINLTWHDF